MDEKLAWGATKVKQGDLSRNNARERESDREQAGVTGLEIRA